MPKNFIFATVRFFWWVPKPTLIWHHLSEHQLSHTCPNQRWYFSKKNVFMYDEFWFLFGHFGTIKHLKHRKYTNCNYLGAKSSRKYMKIVCYSNAEIWSKWFLKKNSIWKQLSHMIRPILGTSGQGGDLGSRVALEAGSGDVIRQSTELLAHVATNLHAVVTSGWPRRSRRGGRTRGKQEEGNPAIHRWWGGWVGGGGPSSHRSIVERLRWGWGDDCSVEEGSSEDGHVLPTLLLLWAKQFCLSLGGVCQYFWS